MVATVDDGRITKLRPDKDHPLSRGYACPKGIAMLDVQNDPDRVVHPLKKGPDGEFHRVSWDEAFDDIGERLRAIIQRHGKKSVAWYMGNPGAFSYSHPLWSKGFVDGLGSPHYYTAGSQDVNNRFAASALLYGSPLVVPIPDLNRTRFLFMVGANPMVSHGSVLTAPRIREQLHEIVGRGGRVVVVDPRRSETARQFEHVPVTPDTDAWLLLSMLHVIFDEGLANRGFLANHADGAEKLAEMVRPFAPEETAARTGVPAETVRELARAMAEPGAAAYGRTGSCLGRFGTLVAFLIDALNAVTGNLDSPGGAVFGRPAIALDDVGEKAGLASYGKVRSRFGGFPDVIGNLPASLLPKEITTPGELQVRALFVSAGNPVLSVPDGDALVEAMGELELCVSLDFYVNETNRHADYILPSPTFYERDDLPLAFLGFYTTPFIQYTDAVVPPAGESREEWEVIDEIAKRIGIVPFSVKAARIFGRLPGLRPHPRRIAELLLRTGPAGDLFGLRRGGLNIGKIAREPHGIVLSEHIPTGVLKEKVRHKGSRLQLAPDADRRRGGSPVGRQRRRPGLPAAADRPARAALAQLLDAQLAATHARRAGADSARQPTRCRGARPRGRRRDGAGLQVGLGGRAGHGDRRDDTRDRCAAARVGAQGRLEGRERRRRGEREPAGELRPRGPRAAGGNGVPERDPGQARAGRRLRAGRSRGRACRRGCCR